MDRREGSRDETRDVTRRDDTRPGLEPGYPSSRPRFLVGGRAREVFRRGTDGGAFGREGDAGPGRTRRRGRRRGVAHEGEEGWVADASRDELISRRRGASLLDVLEEVEAQAFEVGELHELDEVRRGVVGERARRRRLDVVDVDLVPSDEILQRLCGGGVEEISGEETEVTLDRDVELGVGVAVEELAVGLGSGAAEERARVRLEAPVGRQSSVNPGVGGWTRGGSEWEARGRLGARGGGDGGSGRRRANLGASRRKAGGGGGRGGRRRARTRGSGRTLSPTAYIVARSMSAASLSSKQHALPFRRSSCGAAEATTRSCARKPSGSPRPAARGAATTPRRRSLRARDELAAAGASPPESPRRRAFLSGPRTVVHGARRTDHGGGARGGYHRRFPRGAGQRTPAGQRTSDGNRGVVTLFDTSSTYGSVFGAGFGHTLSDGQSEILTGRIRGQQASSESSSSSPRLGATPVKAAERSDAR